MKLPLREPLLKKDAEEEGPEEVQDQALKATKLEILLDSVVSLDHSLEQRKSEKIWPNWREVREKEKRIWSDQQEASEEGSLRLDPLSLPLHLHYRCFLPTYSD